MDLSEIIKSDMDTINKNFHKKTKNGLYLSENQIEVLQKYSIDYESVSNINELTYIIEEVLEEVDYEEDLENTLKEIIEFNYYNNTNK